MHARNDTKPDLVKEEHHLPSASVKNPKTYDARTMQTLGPVELQYSVNFSRMELRSIRGIV